MRLLFMPPLPEDDLNHVLNHTRHLWRELDGARVFLTGGTGFWGAWLVESWAYAARELKLQTELTVLTRDADAFLQKSPHLVHAPNLSFVEGDVRTFAFPAQTFSHVIHAATPTVVEAGKDDPLEMFDIIALGARRVLELAATRGAKRFLLASSGAVYGAQPPELAHVDEEYSRAPFTTDSRAAYGNGKRAAESLSVLFGHKHGIEVSIARGFAFVGPHLNLDAHFAIGNFLRDAMRGGPIQIQGDGTPLRSYLYAADLTIWLLAILLRGHAGRAYNVGSDKALSILETAQIVAGCFEPQPQILVAQKPQAGVLPTRYVPSTQRAQSELGLSEKISLSQAVVKTRRWHESF